MPSGSNKKNSLQKSFACFVVVVASSSLLSTPASEAKLLQQLNSLSSRCFDSGEIDTCQRALMLSEDLQRMAESKENYPCQTRALGLGADLILSQLQGGLDPLALTMLNEVNKRCVGI